MTQKLHWCLTALLFVLFSTQAYDAQADIKEMMTDAEFKASGLDKLSSAELAALLAWINRREGSATQGSVSVVPSTTSKLAPLAVEDTPISAESDSQSENAVARFGKEQIEKPVEKDVPVQITAKLNGEFRGWDGQTVFRLDNGQVWRQRVGGKYRSPRRMNPEVMIEKGRFGYYLKIVESGRTVAVKRVR